MATITSLTAERMLEIEGSSVIFGEIVGGNLILTKHDGTTIDCGPVTGPPGPVGPVGPVGFSAIPGEVKLWPGSTLPLPADFGKWVWADGLVYTVATYPKAAANIAAEWRTFAGASDPGVLNFRVPDLRGLVPAGLDKMPGGARANRLTRAVSIILAGRTGEEIHTITIPEMPSHYHVDNSVIPASGGGGGSALSDGIGGPGGNNTSAVGGGQAHENMQPTVFVPYIVKLDD
jgi:microcystin-dependent protein